MLTFFIKRPRFAMVIALVITLLGAIALKLIPVEQYPQITPPVVNVSASWPGASAADVAEAIATLKVLGHTELIKTTETLDREALKRQPGDILQQVGAYIRTVDEFYYDVSSKEADA